MTLTRSLIRVAPSGISGNNACGKVSSSSTFEALEEVEGTLLFSRSYPKSISAEFT
jgi:hypothetical protein